MIDENFARLRTHRNNVQRYRHLLETSLTALERQFIAKRLAEEQSAIEALSASMPACKDPRIPKLALQVPKGPNG
jgi:hypothetical protein